MVGAHSKHCLQLPFRFSAGISLLDVVGVVLMIFLVTFFTWKVNCLLGLALADLPSVVILMRTNLEVLWQSAHLPETAAK